MQNAQLPNIKGETDMGIFTQGGRGSRIGAIDMTYDQGTRASISSGTYATYYLKFDAHGSNTTYVDGGEVRPANYTIRIWQRMA